MSRPITRQESNAYLAGWGDAHRGLGGHTGRYGLPENQRAYARGFQDCIAGKISADWMLGPDKLPDGATTEEP